MTITKERKQEITQEYFSENLKPHKLSPEEYEYYYQEFAVANEIKTKIGYLYFDFTGYGVTLGETIIRKDRNDHLIEKIYKVHDLFYHAIGDKIEQVLSEKTTNYQKIITNLEANNHLFAFLGEKLNIAYNTPLEFDRLEQKFIDLTGKIEEQNKLAEDSDNKGRSFFNLKTLTYFRDESKKIDRFTQNIPVTIQSLINWYSII